MLTSSSKDVPQQAEFNAPMVEVARPEGPQLVFRAWTDEDVCAAGSHLPNPADPGTNFAEELQMFCRDFRPTGAELRRLLAMKAKPSDLQRVMAKLPQCCTQGGCQQSGRRITTHLFSF